MNGNSVNITALGPSHKLRFYWAVNGTSTWHAETVAGNGSAYSAPSMNVDGNGVNITVAGPRNRLRFYWAINGTSTWHPETIAGPGSTYSEPSMTVNQSAVNITSVGAITAYRSDVSLRYSPIGLMIEATVGQSARTGRIAGAALLARSARHHSGG